MAQQTLDCGPDENRNGCPDVGRICVPGLHHDRHGCRGHGHAWRSKAAAATSIPTTTNQATLCCTCKTIALEGKMADGCVIGGPHARFPCRSDKDMWVRAMGIYVRLLVNRLHSAGSRWQQALILASTAHSVLVSIRSFPSIAGMASPDGRTRCMSGCIAHASSLHRFILFSRARCTSDGQSDWTTDWQRNVKRRPPPSLSPCIRSAFLCVPTVRCDCACVCE